MKEYTQTEVEENIAWFQDNQEYMSDQSSLELYGWIEKMVSREIRGQGEVLDIGNGGFFNYDTNLARRVTAVDLFLEEGKGPTPNSIFRRGSILELPFEAESFDCILLQNVLHHVTGKSAAENLRNLSRSISEIHRCAKIGGKVVIVESTVGEWFYPLERLLFRPLLALKKTGHPVTFQFTPRLILDEIRNKGFEILEYADVPYRGYWIIQFGYKWPTALTPARPVKIVLSRVDT